MLGDVLVGVDEDNEADEQVRKTHTLRSRRQAGGVEAKAIAKASRRTTDRRTTDRQSPGDRARNQAAAAAAAAGRADCAIVLCHAGSAIRLACQRLISP